MKDETALTSRLEGRSPRPIRQMTHPELERADATGPPNFKQFDLRVIPPLLKLAA
jgi:hypothetical protein